MGHQFGLVLNCGVSRLNKGTTQQRMLLPQAEEAAGATYSLETGFTTHTCRPGRSPRKTDENRCRGWKMGSQDKFPLINCKQLEVCLKMILAKEILKIVAIRSRFVNFMSYKYISSKVCLMRCGHIFFFFFFFTYSTPKSFSPVLD